MYNPTTYDFIGQLTDATGNVIANPGLWEIVFGQANPSVGDPNTLYFAAGLNQEHDGLFGSIAAVAATTTGNFTLTPSANAVTVTRGGSAPITLTLAPSAGFTGTVQLACSGLPAGTTCSFSQPSISVTGTANVQSIVTIASSTTYTPPVGYGVRAATSPKDGGMGMAAAGIMPLAGLLLMGVMRRRKLLAVLPIALLGLAAVAGFAGCGGSSGGGKPVTTPTGTSQVTITATSGQVSQSTTVTLTVQ